MVVHAKICNIFVIYGLQNTEFLEKMKKEIQALCYRTYFRKHFVSLQRYKIKERCKTRFPKRGEHKKMRIMKKNANEIFMLQYQIKRYQAMGNGTMCQTLNGKLQKLLAKQPLVTM